MGRPILPQQARMPMEVRQDMKREVDLIQRFAGAYRQRFAQLIDRLNGSTPAVSSMPDSHFVLL